MSSKRRIIILSFLTLVFLTITFLVINKNTSVTNLDYKVYTFIESHQSPFYLNSMLSITKICDVPESIVILIVFGLFLLYKNRKSLCIFTIATFSGIILTEILKYTIQRARPYNLFEHGFSFPSAHATISTIFLLSSVFLLAPLIKNRFSKNIFILVTFITFPIVAYSRIYLSVHWTSDVIAGVLLGSICFISAGIACCQKKENVL